MNSVLRERDSRYFPLDFHLSNRQYRCSHSSYSFLKHDPFTGRITDVNNIDHAWQTEQWNASGSCSRCITRQSTNRRMCKWNININVWCLDVDGLWTEVPPHRLCLSLQAAVKSPWRQQDISYRCHCDIYHIVRFLPVHTLSVDPFQILGDVNPELSEAVRPLRPTDGERGGAPHLPPVTRSADVQLRLRGWHPSSRWHLSLVYADHRCFTQIHPINTLKIQCWDLWNHGTTADHADWCR